MSFLRGVLCVILPPVAVLDKGLGSILVVTVLWILGWIPGIIGAVVICFLSNKEGGGRC